ncbi:MAG: AAA family ATPase, partial [Gammaproteobacteria bacterium]|nr:AAA family ATPase [Gammaproteobacteria bacterium]
SPFSITPDTSLFFPNPDHVAALSYMQYGLESGGFTLVTGEIGLGKTLLCRELLKNVPENIHTAYIFNPLQSREDLLKSIHLDLTGEQSDAESLSQLHDAIYQALLKIADKGGKAAIIIDEVHCLPPDVLEALRLVSNLETEKKKLLSFILVGQPEIRKTLALESLRALSQRISVSHTLQPMSMKVTIDYIEHRLSHCQAHSNFDFSYMACFWIYQYSKGIPRRINQICDRAILAAYAKNRTYVTASIAINAAKEIIRI